MSVCACGRALTPREREVATLVAEGLENREIAARLGCSPWTVKAHVQCMIAKLAVRNRVQLAVYAVREGVGP